MNCWNSINQKERDVGITKSIQNAMQCNLCLCSSIERMIFRVLWTVISTVSNLCCLCLDFFLYFEFDFDPRRTCFELFSPSLVARDCEEDMGLWSVKSVSSWLKSEFEPKRGSTAFWVPPFGGWSLRDWLANISSVFFGVVAIFGATLPALSLLILSEECHCTMVRWCIAKAMTTAYT